MAFRQTSNKNGWTDRQIAARITSLGTLAQADPATPLTDLVQAEFTFQEAKRGHAFIVANPRPSALHTTDTPDPSEGTTTVDKQRIKTNATITMSGIAYYGGTIGSGVWFMKASDTSNPLTVAVLVVFVLLVEGILRTLLDEVFTVGAPGKKARFATTTGRPAKAADTATDN